MGDATTRKNSVEPKLSLTAIHKCYLIQILKFIVMMSFIKESIDHTLPQQNSIEYAQLVENWESESKI